jgi:hypothetical protein
MITNYKCTFDLKEGKSTSVTQKQMLSQREQYGSIVHLFIGTGCSLCKITAMPFTFVNNSIVIHQGLNSLSPLSRLPFLLSRRSSPTHSFSFYAIFRILCASSHCGFDLSPKVPVHVSYSRNIVNHVFEDLRKPKARNSSPTQY